MPASCRSEPSGPGPRVLRRAATPATPRRSPRTSPTTPSTSSRDCRRSRGAQSIGEQTAYAVEHAAGQLARSSTASRAGDEAVIEFANHWTDPRDGERKTIRGTEWFRFARRRAHRARSAPTTSATGSCGSQRVGSAIARMRELADIVLPDQDGNDVRLGDLWAERPVALVWLRHYG